MGFYEIGNGCDSCATLDTPSVQNYNGNSNGLMSSVPVSGAVNVPVVQTQPVVQVQQPQVVQQSTTVQPQVETPKQVVQSMNNKVNGFTNGPQLNINLPSSMFYLNRPSFSLLFHFMFFFVLVCFDFTIMISLSFVHQQQLCCGFLI